MDQHPIPQNVTGFQFKLIGKMTVKQFGYVAIGVIAAFITYYIPIGGIVGVMIKIILLPLFGATGAIIAFVPIDGRPIDTMAGNFMKAFLAPNQYIYHKTGVQFSFSKIKSATRVAPVSHTQKKTSNASQTQANTKAHELQKLLTQSYANKAHNPQDTKEVAYLNSLLQTTPITSNNPQSPIQPTQQAKTSISTPQPSLNTTQAPQPSKENAQTEALTEKESTLKKQLEDAKITEAQGHNQQEIEAFHQKTMSLEAQLAQTHAQKQALEKEIASLKNQLIAQTTPAPSLTQAAKKQTPPEKNRAHVRSIPADMNKKMGLIASDTPNVVMGVVKDSRGNVLPNILVEIKDKADNPVRAFKTNSLGNFASATPLSAGEYIITLEDPKKQQTFDEIKVTLTNQIMLPLEIISYDKREELRKELFSQ